jgi:methionyl-tRNA synthetase
VKDLINYDDFGKLEVRAGLVVAASAPEWSEKLIRYEIDLGEELGVRILFSGIRKWYTPGEIVGKMLPVIVNMVPKKMGEEFSQGMVMMVDTVDKPILIYLPEGVKPGDVIR